MVPAVVLLLGVGAVVGCDGGSVDPPPRPTPSAGCDEVRARGADGIAALAVAVSSGGDAQALVPCAAPEAIDTLGDLAQSSSPLSDLEPCWSLPNGQGTAFYCWARSSEGEVVTLRIDPGVRGHVLGSVSLGGADYDQLTPGTLATEGVPELPIRPVEAQVPIDPAAARGVQAFADDVYMGEASRLTQFCWTMSPDYVAEHYASPLARGAILDALASPLEGAQTGAYADGQVAAVSFSWHELDSPYPCPQVRFHGSDNEPTVSDYAWEIHRLKGRLDGNPVSRNDLENAYPLYCSTDPGGYVSQQGVERERPPTAVDPSAVNQTLQRSEWASLRVHRNTTLGITLVLDADQTGLPALVWYDVVGGPCLGDTWRLDPAAEPTGHVDDPHPDPANLVVSTAGLGPLKVGPHPPESNPGAAMIRFEPNHCAAEAAATSSDPGRWVPDGYDAMYRWISGEKDFFFAVLADHEGVQWIDIFGVDPRTSEGLGVGSTVAELRTAHPGLQGPFIPEWDTTGEIQVWWISDDAGSLVFETEIDPIDTNYRTGEPVVLSMRVLAPGLPTEWSTAYTDNVAGAC